MSYYCNTCHKTHDTNEICKEPINKLPTIEEINDLIPRQEIYNPTSREIAQSIYDLFTNKLRSKV